MINIVEAMCTSHLPNDLYVGIVTINHCVLLEITELAIKLIAVPRLPYNKGW